MAAKGKVTTRSPKKGTHIISRDKAGAPRRHYLATAVTEKEREAILEYCNRHKKSVSAFLADLALEDARRPDKSKLADKEITLTLRFSARDIDKMHLFARLEEKSVEDLLRELVQPGLQKRQTFTNLPMRTIRCWLSDAEHKAIRKNSEKCGLSARSYLALLALKAIERR